MFDILGVNSDSAQSRSTVSFYRAVKFAVSDRWKKSPSAAETSSGKGGTRNRKKSGAAMSRRFRESAPRGAPNKTLGIGRSYTLAVKPCQGLFFFKPL